MKKRWIIYFSLICICFGMYQPMAAKAAVQYKYLELNTKVQSYQKTKLIWKKKKVDEYHIYQNGKKIAVLAKNKRTYIAKTKKNKEYTYQIKGIKYTDKTKKKKAIVYTGNCYAYSGVSHGYFDEYCYIDSETTPDSITLNWVRGDMEDGFVLYRKKGNGSYQKLATFKKKYSYIDKQVETGVIYTYKICPYKIMNGKKVYGECSDGIKKMAVWRKGRYQVTKISDQLSQIYDITADAGNGTLTISAKELFDRNFLLEEKNEAKRISAYSYDGENWFENNTDLVKLEAGKHLYLRVVSSILTGEEENTPKYEACYGVFQRGYIFEIKPDGTAVTYSNAEMWH